jgi:probable HAF family extracellular repeat protein
MRRSDQVRRVLSAIVAITLVALVSPAASAAAAPSLEVYPPEAPVLGSRLATVFAFVTNYGDEDATGASLTIAIPTGLTFDSAAANVPVSCSGSAPVSCEIGTLPSGVEAGVWIRLLAADTAAPRTIGGTVSLAADQLASALTAPYQITVLPSPPPYRLVDLGSLGTGATTPTDLSDSGRSTGNSLVGSDPHAFRVTRNGGMTDLGTPGAARSLGVAIADDGTVVGSLQLPLGAFIAPAGQPAVPLPGLGGGSVIASDISPNGQVAGSGTLPTGSFRAFRHVNGTTETLPTLGGAGGIGELIGDNGDVLGRSQDPAGISRPTRWSGSTPSAMATPCRAFDLRAVSDSGRFVAGSVCSTDAPDEEESSAAVWDGTSVRTLTGDCGAVAVDVNDAGVVAYNTNRPCTMYGSSVAHRVSGATDLPLFGLSELDPVVAYEPRSSFAVAVDDEGSVVGWYETASAEERAFLFTRGVTFDLAEIVTGGVPAGFELGRPVDINDEGEILLAGRAGGIPRALLLTTRPAGPADGDPPSISITSPSPDQQVSLGAPLIADFGCTDPGSGIASCVAEVGGLPVADGQPIDTSSGGSGTMTVSALDNVGNGETASVRFEVLAGSTSETVTGDGGPVSVTTDPSGVGASVEVPIQTGVTFPLADGEQRAVALELLSSVGPSPDGYAFLGREVVVDLGGVTAPASNPIVLTFVIDGSLSPDPDTISILRTIDDDSTDVAAPCVGPIAADPDPCFTAAFAGTPDGDVVVTVRTTHASTWAPIVRSPFSFSGFFQPVDNGVVNVAKAGSAIPVRFSLGGDQGRNIFARGFPKVVSRPAGGLPTDVIEQTVAASESALLYDGATGRYTYIWKTSKAMAGGTWELVMKFADGQTRSAMFRLR